MTTPARDTFGRPLGSLRLSVTDRCNLRCQYCMPETDYTWLPRESILTFEEFTRLTRLFVSLGVTKVRLTGGEPLLRQELGVLVSSVRGVPGVRDLALTTNGVLLAPAAAALREAGLDRVTVSLDTLRPERLQSFARSSRHQDIVSGIRAARDAGLGPVKLNSVIVRGFNEDEIIDLLDFARAERAELRYIEYMDVGGATRWSMDDVVTRDQILACIAKRMGRASPVERSGDPSIGRSGDHPSTPAERYELPDGTRFGIIASVTAPFCRDCDRSRITADGTWFLCLYADHGIDLRTPLRTGATDAELIGIIRDGWAGRRDRGAEARAASPGRSALHGIAGLRADPRREMHTRGG